MSAPIATSASRAPARVGLRPTFSTVTSLPATVAAATNRNVADDRSPGMTIGIARSFPFQPRGSTTTAPVPASTAIGAPIARSMRSV